MFVEQIANASLIQTSAPSLLGVQQSQAKAGGCLQFTINQLMWWEINLLEKSCNVGHQKALL